MGERSKSLILFVLGLIFLFCWAAGCAVSREVRPSPGGSKPPAESGQKETRERITLYFGDRQAQWLVPEEREVIRKGEPLEEIVVRELIKGPAGKDLHRSIPEGAQLLSLTVAGGVARVNFSREFQTKHWGGSTGESFTVYSVVNSLTRLEGIDKVLFLVEGEKIESLAGHMDLTEPLGPSKTLIKKQSP